MHFIEDNALEAEPAYVEITEPVRIPTLDGTQFAETVHVKVPAWRDPADGEIYLDSDATQILEKVKARHLGLLTTSQIKALRQRLGLTQKEICRLLQIGMKTWTRWETGRERPFRSINVLLCALNDGKIDVGYLRALAELRRERSIKPTDSQSSHYDLPPARNQKLGPEQHSL